MSPLLRQFSNFSLVGAVGTLAHYTLLIGLVSGLAVAPLPASMAGALLGALVNYGLNYRYTFASTRAHREAFPRFAIVAVIGFACNACIMWAAVGIMHYLLAQALATGVVLAAGFFANRAWTFWEKTS